LPISFLNEIVARCDLGIDLHSAAVHRKNLPQVRISPNNPRTAELAQVFGAPVILKSPLREGSLRGAAKAIGRDVILFEAGEGLRFDEFSVRVGVAGILRVLRHIGMVPGKGIARPKAAPQNCSSSKWMRAPAGGLLRAFRDNGDVVSTGDLMAVVSDPFGGKERELLAPFKGIIVGRAVMPVVNEGDAVFHVARVKSVAQAEEAVGDLSDQLSDDPLFDEDEITPGPETPACGLHAARRTGSPAALLPGSAQASRKHTLSASSRAKPISWVARIIVMPSRCSCRSIQHLADQFRVERGGDLVEQHDLRLHRQRPDDRHALLLAARELVGIMVHVVGKTEALEQPHRAGKLAARATAHPHGREHHVFARAHMREEVVGLEHDADPLAHRLRIEPRLGDVHAVQKDRAVVDRLQQVDAAQQRRLAGPRRADQADHLALPDIKVDAPADLMVAKALAHAAQRELGT
jgi:hypothetical protein